jgi:GntR family transcriptional repressor for pyruvate dehydrogenase complex
MVRKLMQSAAKMDMPRLPRVDLVQHVVDSLQEQILSGRLAPNEPLLPEGQLSVQLGVSRTVIREAMRILGAKGLVVVSRGKLPRVKPADSTHVVDSITAFLQRANHPLRHLVEVRRHLETSIAALAAERATPEQVEAMEEANRQLLKANTLDQRVEADIRFHTLLAEATGNPIFAMLIEPITHLLRLSMAETLSRSGEKRAAKCHEKILAAIRHADSEAAKQAMLDLVATAEMDLSQDFPCPSHP